MVSCENIQTSNISDWPVYVNEYMYIHVHVVYMYTWMCIATISENRVPKFEDEQDGYLGGFEGKKGKKKML